MFALCTGVRVRVTYPLKSMDALTMLLNSSTLNGMSRADSRESVWLERMLSNRGLIQDAFEELLRRLERAWPRTFK